MRKHVHVDLRDFVLALVGLAPNKTVPGRTILQKTAYFCMIKMGHEDLFVPYYFGPYSSEIADAVSSLVSLGFIAEGQQMVYPPYIRYEYKLTEEGEQLLNTIETIPEDVLKTIKEIISAIENNSLWHDSVALSTAAKTHYILRKSGQLMTPEAISDYAQNLGWDIKPESIEQIVKFLKDLDLVVTHPFS